MQRVQYLSSVGEIGWGSPDLPWAMRLHFSLKQTLGKKKTQLSHKQTPSIKETHFSHKQTHISHTHTQKAIINTKHTTDKQTLTKKKHISPTNKNSEINKTKLD